MTAMGMPPDLARRGVIFLGGLRTAFGVVALIAPNRATAGWVGRAPGHDRDSHAVLARALGGRDLALGLGALAAARRNSDVRSWILAGTLADAGDLTATLARFRTLPWTGRYGVTALTVAAVLAGAAVAAALDGEEQPGW